MYVTCDQAKAFAKYFSLKNNILARLPTDDEWEYLSRSGLKEKIYPDGLNSPFNHLSFNEHSLINDSLSKIRTPQINHKNKWGLVGLHSGPEEWTSSNYKSFNSPPLPHLKSVRGGDGYNDYEYRSSYKRSSFCFDSKLNLSFRIVFDDNSKQMTNFIKKQIISDFSSFNSVSLSSLYNHHHQPSISVIENEIVAWWYATNQEHGREMIILSSRYDLDKQFWSHPQPSIIVKDRNQTGLSSYYDKEDKTLYIAIGVSDSVGYRENNIGIILISKDGGKSFENIKEISKRGNIDKIFQPINGILKIDNNLYIPSDDPITYEDGATSIWKVNLDDFNSELIRNIGMGIHGSIIYDQDKNLLISVGRRKGSNNTSGLPLTKFNLISNEKIVSFLEFPNIGGGQRAHLGDLEDGSYLLASFTNRKHLNENRLSVKNQNDQKIEGLGLFISITKDFKKWCNKILLTPSFSTKADIQLNTRGKVNFQKFSSSKAETGGYLSGFKYDDSYYIFSSGIMYKLNIDEAKKDHAMNNSIFSSLESLQFQSGPFDLSNILFYQYF